MSSTRVIHLSNARAHAHTHAHTHTHERTKGLHLLQSLRGYCSAFFQLIAAACYSPPQPCILLARCTPTCAVPQGYVHGRGRARSHAPEAPHGKRTPERRRLHDWPAMLEFYSLGMSSGMRAIVCSFLQRPDPTHGKTHAHTIDPHASPPARAVAGKKMRRSSTAQWARCSKTTARC